MWTDRCLYVYSVEFKKPKSPTVHGTQNATPEGHFEEIFLSNFCCYNRPLYRSERVDCCFAYRRVL